MHKIAKYDRSLQKVYIYFFEEVRFLLSSVFFDDDDDEGEDDDLESSLSL